MLSALLACFKIFSSFIAMWKVLSCHKVSIDIKGFYLVIIGCAALVACGADGALYFGNLHSASAIWHGFQIFEKADFFPD
jgi:hypothetical protein